MLWPCAVPQFSPHMLFQVKSSVPMLGICMTAMTCSLCAGLSYLQLHMHTRACDASDWLNALLVLCRTSGHGRRQSWWRHATAARMPATWCGPSCWGCRLMTCLTAPLPAWCGMPSAAPPSPTSRTPTMSSLPITSAARCRQACSGLPSRRFWVRRGMVVLCLVLVAICLEYLEHPPQAWSSHLGPA